MIFFDIARRAGFKSWAERKKIVDEAYSVGNTVSGFARKHGIARRLIQDWRAKLDKLNDQGEMNPIDWRVKCRKDSSATSKTKGCTCVVLHSE